MPSADRSSFEELYHTYQSRVYNLALSYLQNEGDAEELTQDIFVEVYHALASFRGEASAGTWIYRITVNRAIDFLRKKSRKKRLGTLLSLFRDTGTPESPDFIHPGVLLEHKERSATLFAAIETLPENQKTAFILARVEDLGNKEIAEIMQLSVGAVESLLSRARENLKKQLAVFYPEWSKRRN